MKDARSHEHQITATLIKLCISKVRVFSFVLYGKRRSCRNLLYHILPKNCLFFIKNKYILCYEYFLLLAFHTVLETTKRSLLNMDSNTRDDLISPILLRAPGTCRSCLCFATEVLVTVKPCRTRSFKPTYPPANGSP